MNLDICYAASLHDTKSHRIAEDESIKRLSLRYQTKAKKVPCQSIFIATPLQHLLSEIYRMKSEIKRRKKGKREKKRKKQAKYSSRKCISRGKRQLHFLIAPPFKPLESIRYDKDRVGKFIHIRCLGAGKHLFPINTADSVDEILLILLPPRVW